MEKRWFLKTTFDSGSNADAVSEKVAIQLKKLGVPAAWTPKAINLISSGDDYQGSVIRSKIAVGGGSFENWTKSV